jgi:hypothetical protein
MQIHAGKMRCNWEKTIGIGPLKLMFIQLAQARYSAARERRITG